MDAFSAEYLFFHAAQRMPKGDASQGLYLNAALSALQIDGQPKEGDCPYLSVAMKTGTWAPPKGCTLFRANGGTAKGAVTVRHWLNQGIVSMVVVRLGARFYAVDGKGELPLDDDHGSNFGQHAMVAMGHRSIGKSPAILVRNSWGVAWGDQGHAWLPDTYLNDRLVSATTVQPL